MDHPAESISKLDFHFNKKQNEISLQHGEHEDTRKPRYDQNSRRTVSGEVGRPDSRGKSTEIGHAATPRYVVGGSDRILQAISVVNTISKPDSEVLAQIEV